MNGHILAKRSHLFRKASFRFCAQPVYPELQSFLGRSEQALPFTRFELLRQRDRRQLGSVQDLVRIRIADAAQNPWIGESPLESAVFGGQRITKRAQIAAEDVDSSRVHRLQTLLAADDIQ